MNSKSFKEGGKHSMYGKAKRFIASFLAIVMAVCMLPAEMLGAVGVALAAAPTAPGAAPTLNPAGTEGAYEFTIEASDKSVKLGEYTESDKDDVTIYWVTSEDGVDNFDTIDAAGIVTANKHSQPAASAENTTVIESVTGEVTVKAVAVTTGTDDESGDTVYEYSGITAVTYTVATPQKPTVTATPWSDEDATAGKHTFDATTGTVTLTASAGTVYYVLSTDNDYGTTSADEGAIVDKNQVANGSITISELTTIKAVAKDGENVGDVQTFVYDVTNGTQPQVGTIMADPAAGTVASGTSVTLSYTAVGEETADIYYTTTATSEPTPEDLAVEENKYTDGTTNINIEADTTIYAVAKVGDGDDAVLGIVQKFVYNIDQGGSGIKEPELEAGTPESFTSNLDGTEYTVTLNSGEGTVIYYVTNISDYYSEFTKADDFFTEDATKSSYVYKSTTNEVNVRIAENQTKIKAIAVKTNADDEENVEVTVDVDEYEYSNMEEFSFEFNTSEADEATHTLDMRNFVRYEYIKYDDQGKEVSQQSHPTKGAEYSNGYFFINETTDATDMPTNRARFDANTTTMPEGNIYGIDTTTRGDVRTYAPGASISYSSNSDYMIKFKTDKKVEVKVVAKAASRGEATDSSIGGTGRYIQLLKKGTDTGNVTADTAGEDYVVPYDPASSPSTSDPSSYTAAKEFTWTVDPDGTLTEYGIGALNSILIYSVQVKEIDNEVNPPAVTVDAPTFDPAVADDTDPYVYQFTANEGRVKIEAGEGTTIYYVLSTESGYDAFVDDAEEDVYIAGNEYTDEIDAAGGVEVTYGDDDDGMSIKAVAIDESGNISKVAESPVYYLGEYAALEGNVTVTPGTETNIVVGDEPINVTLSYSEAEIDVKYIFAINNDNSGEKTVAGFTGTEYTETDGVSNITLPTDTARDIVLKVLAYTVDENNDITAVASRPVEFTYTVKLMQTAETYLVSFTDYNDDALTLTVKNTEGNDVDLAKVSKDTVIVLPNTTTERDGYTFQGWKIDGAGDTYSAGNEYTVSTNVTFKEVWKSDSTSGGVPEDVPTTGMYVRFVDSNGNKVEGDKAYSYTGVKVEPIVEVYNNAKLLTAGTDYTVKYKNNINAGTASVTVTGKGNFSGSANVINFTINPADIATAASCARDMTVIANTKVAPIIMHGTKKLGTKDFEISDASGKLVNSKYADLTEDGKTNTLTVTGKGNYDGSSFNINVKVIDKSAALKLAVTVDKTLKPVYGEELSFASLIKSGTNEGGQITVTDSKDKTKILEEGKDFTIICTSSLTEAGTVKFTAIGMGEYTGSVSKSFKISPLKVTDTNKFKVEFDETKEYEYKASGVTVDGLKVTYLGETDAETDDVVLREGIDYKVTYSNNKKVSSSKNAQVKITFLGSYKGSKAVSKDFTIATAKMTTGENANTVVVVPDKVYNKDNAAYKSTPIVTVNGTTIKASNYTVSYAWKSASEQTYKDDDKVKITLAGEDTYAEVKVTITPKPTSSYAAATVGDDTAVIEGTYYVRKAVDGAIDLSKATVKFVDKDGNQVKALNYNGKEFFTPNTTGSTDFNAVYVTVSTKQDGEVPSDLYTVRWTNATEKGKATVVITGTGTAKDGKSAIGSKNATISIKAMALKGTDLANSIKDLAQKFF